MSWNPISTRLSAVLWILGWKILDFWTTYDLISLSSTSEMNPLINSLTPVIGLEASLMTTVFLAVGFTYGLYYAMPVVVEVLAFYLPLAVIGNLSVYIHPLLNNLVLLFGISSFIGYLVYYELTKRRNKFGFGDSRFLYTASIPE
jgi:hypothetical protein